VTDERQPRGLGFALRDPFRWDELVALARAGEERGYAALFQPEIAARDTLAAITGLASETSLFLGTGVVPLPSRSTQLLAMAAATAQERSGGRLVLGLGTGPSGPGALARLRAVVTALRQLFATGEANLDGERLALSLVPDRPPRLWIAALGPRAVRTAGAVADGVLLNWCTPERVSRAVAEVAQGAEEAGRERAEVTLAVYVRARVADDAGLALARRAAGEYASYPAYARQFAALGLGSEAVAAARAFRAGRPEEVPESLARSVCLLGDPADARDRLRAYVEVGADLAIVYPLTSGPDAAGVLATLTALAPGA
jgi:alkanesulfonate monooxygenase SsuD/methylene tetrahydromethanopterin reductase-like flavin-dependent oxidoreductase (luciferase family)